MRHANISVFVPHMGCPHRCSFCDQNSITGTGFPVTPEDIDAAVSAAKCSPKYSAQDTELAFFGGSFTAIDRSFTEPLLKKAKEYIDSGVISGIRISTRPDYIDDDILTYLKKYGVTAIELGAQSMDDDVLRLNLRGHTAEDVRSASHAIRESGFELGLQMMTGLYGDTAEYVRRTCREFIALNPDTVRVYPTVILKHTRLGKLFESGEFRSFGFEQTVDLCAELLRDFTAAGIRVIRMGLHASQEVEREMLGGVYHPAFREIVESRLFLNDMKQKLLAMDRGNYVIYTDSRNISRAVGQKRSNIAALHGLGYDVEVKPLDGAYIEVR